MALPEHLDSCVEGKIMKLSCCMTANRNNLELLAQLKYDGIEIPGCVQLNPEKVTGREILELKSLLCSYNIEVAASNVIYPGDFRHINPKGVVGARSVSYTRDLIRMSSELGNEVLVFGGRNPKEHSVSGIPRTRDGLPNETAGRSRQGGGRIRHTHRHRTSEPG